MSFIFYKYDFCHCSICETAGWFKLAFNQIRNNELVELLIYKAFN